MSFVLSFVLFVPRHKGHQGGTKDTKGLGANHVLAMIRPRNRRVGQAEGRNPPLSRRRNTLTLAPYSPLTTHHSLFS